MIIDQIKLGRLNTSEKGFVPTVDIMLDGIQTKCILDTGAASTSVRDDGSFQSYEVDGQKDMSGASGVKIKNKLIKPLKVEFGHQIIQQPTIELAHQGFFGIDLLSEYIFEIDLNNNSLNFFSSFPDNVEKNSLNLLKAGHIVVEVLIGGIATKALFDTGADTNIFDKSFVGAHPDIFRYIRDENGTDSTNVTFSSQIFECSGLEVGGKKFKGHECGVFDFSQNMKEAMPGTPLILGASIIGKLRWLFDPKNMCWAIR